jgi:hypothetical protein
VLEWVLTCMDEQQLAQVVQEMADWGYATFDPLHPGSPGDRILAVAMRPQPVQVDFDPVTLELTVFDANQASRVVTLHHHTPMRSGKRVCPGRITLRDRRGNVARFYSYGGELTIMQGQPRAEDTLYIVESSAPILPWLSDYGLAVGEQLEAETEALLARLRPRLHANQDEGLQQLLKMPPDQLYAGCIASLLAYYEHSPALEHAFPEQHQPDLLLPLEQLVTDAARSR